MSSYLSRCMSSHSHYDTGRERSVISDYARSRPVHFVGPTLFTLSLLSKSSTPHSRLISEDEKIGLLKTCKELGVAVIPYSPLGRGLLTGQYKCPLTTLRMVTSESISQGSYKWLAHTLHLLHVNFSSRFSKENFPKILEVVDGVAEIGKKHNATAGQVTLAWIFSSRQGVHSYSRDQEGQGSFDLESYYFTI